MNEIILITVLHDFLNCVILRSPIEIRHRLVNIGEEMLRAHGKGLIECEIKRRDNLRHSCGRIARGKALKSSSLVKFPSNLVASVVWRTIGGLGVFAGPRGVFCVRGAASAEVCALSLHVALLFFVSGVEAQGEGGGHVQFLMYMCVSGVKAQREGGGHVG